MKDSSKERGLHQEEAREPAGAVPRERYSVILRTPWKCLRVPVPGGLGGEQPVEVHAELTEAAEGCALTTSRTLGSIQDSFSNCEQRSHDARLNLIKSVKCPDFHVHSLMVETLGSVDAAALDSVWHHFCQCTVKSLSMHQGYNHHHGKIFVFEMCITTRADNKRRVNHISWQSIGQSS